MFRCTSTISIIWDHSTNKSYKSKHILAIIDAFTKFVWLYSTKTVSSKEVIQKLEQQKYIFDNPSRIITDRGTSTEFEDYCRKENIEHLKITVGLPRFTQNSLYPGPIGR